MSRQLNMHHLHLGCGESLSRLVSEPPLPKPVKAPAKPRVARTVRKSKKGGGR